MHGKGYHLTDPMNVDIKYPSGFPLTGWEKAMFGFRLRAMFRKEWVDVCALRACRSALGTASHETADLHEDFSALHCARFRDLSPEIVGSLTSKVSDYVGVHVTQVQGHGRLMVKLAIFGTAILALVVGAWPMVHNAAFGSRGTTIAAERTEPVRIPSEEAQPYLGPILPPKPLVSDSVFQARVETGAPREYLRRLAQVIPLDAKRYEIQVTVVPIETSNE